jgi:hypothetical protein
MYQILSWDDSNNEKIIKQSPLKVIQASIDGNHHEKDHHNV